MNQHGTVTQSNIHLVVHDSEEKDKQKIEIKLPLKDDAKSENDFNSVIIDNKSIAITDNANENSMIMDENGITIKGKTIKLNGMEIKK